MGFLNKIIDMKDDLSSKVISIKNIVNNKITINITNEIDNNENNKSLFDILNSYIRIIYLVFNELSIKMKKYSENIGKKCLKIHEQNVTL